jgi:hypothetical protein
VSLADCAAQAVLQWDRETAITMVAISGAETGGAWNNDAAGDPWWNYPGDPLYKTYSCGGHTSWGLWQVNMRWHYPRLQDATGSSDPCVWASYLSNPGANALMAAEILAGQGLSAWSTYNVGAHLAYIAQATAAVDAALGAQPAGPYIQPPIWPPLPVGFLTLRLVDPSAADRSVAPPARAVEPPPGYH